MSQLTLNSVQQLLEVVYGAKRNHNKLGAPVSSAYQDAVRQVAQRHGVTYQTIGDLCRRRLGLGGIEEFYQLLREWFEGEPDPIRERILKHARPDAQPAVRAFFGEDAAPPELAILHVKATKLENRAPQESGTALVPSDLRLIIEPDLMQRLRLAQLAGIGSNLEDTAITLLEAGFAAERETVRRFIENTVG